MQHTPYRSGPISRMYGGFLWLILGLLVSTSACRQKAATEQLITPTDTLPPKITGMVIPGIPPANIKIDQVRRQLIVTVPRDVPANSVSGVQLIMTPGAKKLRDFPLQINFCEGTLNNDTYMVPVTTEDFEYDNHEVIITGGKIKKKYRVQIVPEGPMAFAHPDQVFQVRTGHTGDDDMKDIAVFNYTDTSGYFGSQVIYQDVRTGEVFKDGVAGCADFGKIHIGRPATLPLGEYTMRIQKRSGRQTTNSLRVNVLPGQFTYYGLNHALSTDQTLTITGNSLFAGKPVHLHIWHNRTGQRFAVNEFTFDRLGRTLQARVPVGLTSGYYYSQLTYDGQTSPITRTIVVKDVKQPTIGLILFDNVSTGVTRLDAKQISLQRGQTYWSDPGPANHIRAGHALQFYLQSVTEPSRVYTVPITIPPHWGTSPSWKADDYPSYVFPLTMQPGNYLIRVQYVDKDGVRQVGDWLERDIDLQ